MKAYINAYISAFKQAWIGIGGGSADNLIDALFYTESGTDYYLTITIDGTDYYLQYTV